MVPSRRARHAKRPRHANDAEPFRQIEHAIETRISGLAQTELLHRDKDFAAAQTIGLQGNGKQQMNLLRRLIGEQISDC